MTVSKLGENLRFHIFWGSNLKTKGDFIKAWGFGDDRGRRHLTSPTPPFSLNTTIGFKFHTPRTRENH